jgi:hypothetical protein
MQALLHSKYTLYHTKKCIICLKNELSKGASSQNLNNLPMIGWSN